MSTNEIAPDDIAHLMTKRFETCRVSESAAVIAKMEKDGWSLHSWAAAGTSTTADDPTVHHKVTMLFVKHQTQTIGFRPSEMEDLLAEVGAWRERQEEEYIRKITGVGTGHAENPTELSGSIEAFKQVEELIRRRLPHR